ncbi:MAG TPA: histidine--tRNA ligase [Candidatus Deferrimicrobium sp.]|nr:histidine--tRNA ligase [Candidatus Deferrimicrobium sp.]
MPVANPRLLKGFKDMLPAEMVLREQLISQIKAVYESYGFVPLSTPALEYKEVLLGYGDEASKQIYFFQEPDGCQVGLRFDLTVPLSRVVAQYPDLPRPFKRYQIQPVWRYDKPDPGRFREFIQFDIDTVGTDSVIADAEIISAIHDSLKQLGLVFRVRFSNRKILNSLLVFAGIPAGLEHSVFRVLDKLEKQGIESVKLELGSGRTDESGAKIAGLGLRPAQIDKMERFLALPQRNRGEALQSVKDLFQDVAGATAGIRELEDIHRYLEAVAIDSSAAAIDLSIARGLDYYTGPVFEAILTDEAAAGIGSVMGGGRYDDLIGNFTGQPVPATGASIGVDRLVAAVQRLEGFEMRPSTADVIVVVMEAERIIEYAELAHRLRREGINTELYTGGATSIGKQLKYADRQQIPVAVIVGSDELASGQVSIKDLRKIKQEKVSIAAREEWVEKKIGQTTVPAADLVRVVKSMLGR